MADLIDRDAAHDAIGFERCDRSCTDCPTKCTWFYTVKNIPAVNRWISVEDALPELKKDHESDCVLCYCDTGAYAFSTLQENFFGQVGFACEKEDDYYHSIGKVIAWMPLPEPPKKE